MTKPFRKQFGTVMLACALICQLGFCWGSLKNSLSGFTDFRAFYAAGHIITSNQGKHLYEYEYQQQVENKIVGESKQTLPFIYPAYTALLFVPFSFLSYKVAFISFGLFNLAIFSITGKLVQTHVKSLKGVSAYVVIGSFLCFFPTSMALMQGQMSFVLLFLYTMSYLSFEQGWPCFAGFLVAFTLTKFQIALPVVLIFLCWQKWRFAAGFGCGLLIVMTISFAVTGLPEALEYGKNLTHMTRTTLLHADAAKLKYGMFPTDMPNLHGLFFAMTRGSVIGQVASGICSIVLLLLVRSRQPSFTLALTSAMLVSYHMQPYDLTLLLLPLAVSSGHLLERRDQFLLMDSELANGLKKQWIVETLSLCLSLSMLVVPTAPFLLVHGLCYLFVIAVVGTLLSTTHTPMNDFVKPKFFT